MYSVIDEASGGAYAYTDDLQEAIDCAKLLPKQGKYLVMDDNDVVVYDTKPGISFKF